VESALRALNYDIVSYNASDIRNKAIIDTICRENVSDNNIISLFSKQVKKIAIIMDEVDGMNNGDKGGINALIKLIRPKKIGKKGSIPLPIQPHPVPIVCIGSFHIDKKMKELMKVCYSMELKPLHASHMRTLLNMAMPRLSSPIVDDVAALVTSDFHKLKLYARLYDSKDKENQEHQFQSDDQWRELLHAIPRSQIRNDDIKNVTASLFRQEFEFVEHEGIVHESDRTIVGMLFHENVVDAISTVPQYIDILDKLVFGDYIDRITFQKQIWQFNEMSSLIKTMFTHHLFHENKKQMDTKKGSSSSQVTDIRFTKILTKYSTEYNNMLFLHSMCQALNMDRKDLLSHFSLLLQTHASSQDVFDAVEKFEINKLDVLRLYRFMENGLDPDSFENQCFLGEIKSKMYKVKKSACIASPILVLEDTYSAGPAIPPPPPPKRPSRAKKTVTNGSTQKKSSVSSLAKSKSASSLCISDDEFGEWLSSSSGAAEAISSACTDLDSDPHSHYFGMSMD